MQNWIAFEDGSLLDLSAICVVSPNHFKKTHDEREQNYISFSTIKNSWRHVCASKEEMETIMNQITKLMDPVQIKDSESLY